MDNCYNGQYETYIEERFFERLETCIKDRDLREKIKVAWLSDKQLYTELSSKIGYEFIHYSLHDASHSVSILQYIYLLLGKNRIDKLSVGDLWLLLEVAYSHDIGMSVTYEELVEIWKDKRTINNIIKKLGRVSDEKAMDVFDKIKKLIDKDTNSVSDDFLTNHPNWPIELRKAVSYIHSEYIRQNHPERSKKKIISMIKECSNSKIENRLYKIVGTINHMHGLPFEEIEKQLSARALGFTTDQIHPRMIAMLLRVGDSLDIRNNRFDYWNIQYLGGLPKDSEQHYEKHRAVSEFLVDIHEVKIHIESDNADVCRISRQWLDIIDNELNHMIKYWNSYAPERIWGLYFQTIDLQVKYKSQIFMLDDFEYRLKTEPIKLMNLLSGKNIYKTKLVVFREYLQNAIDATKMKLASQYYNDKKTLNEFLNKKHKETFKDILPNDFSERDFSDRTITINVGTVKDNASNISIEIIDQGIGMDDNGLDALFNIGRGWKEREELSDMILNMPDWLKPTGGFGIGILSAFLMSNKVTYYTKSEKTLRYEMTIYAPNEGGMIEKISKNDYYGPTGTSVSFEIPFGLFLKELWLNYHDSEDASQLTFNDTNDTFKIFDFSNKTYRLNFVVKSLKILIEELMVDIIFPIKIQSDEIELEIDVEANKINDFSRESNNNNALWLDSLQTLVRFNDIEHITNNSNDTITNFGYKGIRVDSENYLNSKNIIVKEESTNLINDGSFLKIDEYKRYLANSFIKSYDIFQGNVDTILDVSRHNFTEEFDLLGNTNIALLEMFRLCNFSMTDKSKINQSLYEALEEFAFYNSDIINQMLDDYLNLFKLLDSYPYTTYNEYVEYLLQEKFNKDVMKNLESLKSELSELEINPLGTINVEIISHIKATLNQLNPYFDKNINPDINLNQLNLRVEMSTDIEKIYLHLQEMDRAFGDKNIGENILDETKKYKDGIQTLKKLLDKLDYRLPEIETRILVKLLIEKGEVYCCYVKNKQNINYFREFGLDSDSNQISENSRFLFLNNLLYVNMSSDYYKKSPVFTNYCNIEDDKTDKKMRINENIEIFKIKLKGSNYNGIENEIAHEFGNVVGDTKPIFSVAVEEDFDKYESICLDFNPYELVMDDEKDKNKSEEKEEIGNIKSKIGYIMNPFGLGREIDKNISHERLYNVDNLYVIHQRFNNSESFRNFIQLVYDCKKVTNKSITYTQVQKTYFELIDNVMKIVMDKKKQEGKNSEKK